MIISHQLQIIYIKLKKVAGSSFEIALSKYCGADDIITPVVRKHSPSLKLDDDDIRQSMGFYGPQNYIDPNTQKEKFDNHATPRTIQKYLPVDIWENYLKIATIRCPYDIYISYYYFIKAKKPERYAHIEFEQFIFENKNILNNLYKLHDKKGELLTDFLLRYEHLDEDIKKLETKINCPGLLEVFQSISAKKNVRPKVGTSSCEIYSKYPNAKLIIDERCRKVAAQYQFFREYWPSYKTKLEESIAKSTTAD